MKRIVFVLSCLFALASLGFLSSSVRSTRAAFQSAQLPVIALANPIGGLSAPIGIANAGDGSNRLFILEQSGRIRIVKNGSLLGSPFLNISTRVSCCGERGLLGLAFPHDYASKGYFYVNYTDLNGNTVIARYRRSLDPDTADPNSEQIVLAIGQPFANHNGGNLIFGPFDRMLYAGMGDGGSGGDPSNRAQSPSDLLGKMLRIDVESGRPYTYTIPSNNPFISTAGFRGEIWALGLRNPWRYSFDRQTGDLYTADVGQGAWEEVNFQPSTSGGGENYGWRIMEGLHCFNPSTGCNMSGLILPVAEYSHALGCSVTGGFVYRGSTFARMHGIFFYGDYCSGRIWGLRRDGVTWQNTLLRDSGVSPQISISSFGEDEAGNLYVASHNTGQVFQIVDTPPMPPALPTPTPAMVQFAAAALSVGEQGISATFDVVRSGDPSVDLTVDVGTADGTATERGDYTTTVGTLHFAAGETTRSVAVLVTNDVRDEPNETVNLTLQNLRGKASLGALSSAQLTILDDDPPGVTSNPIDNSTFFVNQHYADFLNRVPDGAGLQFWTDTIESCGADAQCREVRRINVSAAFFLSIEFQETGFLVYQVHKAATGNVPRFRDFMKDSQAVGRGVVVGVGAWQAQLEANKRAYLNEFVARDAFFMQHATGQSAAQYVDMLNSRSSALSTAERDALISGLINGTETRATVLRKVAEDADFRRAELNSAFVLMQYFGYLRRNPNDFPDSNFDGFNFWLDKLNQFNGNFVQAEMVKAFIASIEYRERFRQ
jgi:glucose/arabinose dehydrogenase